MARCAGAYGFSRRISELDTRRIRVSVVGADSERIESLPDTLDISSVDSLLCGGITVFSPLLTFGIKPSDHVGIVGIGHMGLKFAKVWGVKKQRSRCTNRKLMKPEVSVRIM